MTTWRQIDLLKGPPREQREFRMQVALVDLLDHGGLAQGWDYFAIPNGEFRTEQTGARVKRMGAKAGVPDLQFLSPTGMSYFLELKWGKQPLTGAQQAFFDRNGGKECCTCAVARSFNEAVAILRFWGAIRARVAA
jgi:hypothetical protein